MKNVTTPFGAALAAELRAQFGRTELQQEDAAVILGVHPATLSRKLKGRASISVDELDALAKFLGTTLEKIVASARKAESGGES